MGTTSPCYPLRSLSLDTFLDNKHCNMVIIYAIHGVKMNVKDHEHEDG